MALHQATQREPGATQTAMRGDGFTGIVRAGWIETTVMADVRAQTPLIQVDDEDQYVFHEAPSAGSAALLHRR